MVESEVQARGFTSPGRAARAHVGRLALAYGFAAGLALRAVSIPYRGTADIFTYAEWGSKTDKLGLARAYIGIYFPFEYQLLEVAKILSRLLDASFVVALKLLDLGFDVAIFAVLVVLLGRLGVDRRWALAYWLQPFFLALFWLGYVDFQLGLFVLLTLLVLAFVPAPIGYVVAGVPLGLVFLMKPQSFVLLAMVGLGVVAAAIRHRSLRRPMTAPLAMLAAPVALFAAYSEYFDRNGKSLSFLARTYRAADGFFPALTANMPNIWYPVAEAYRKADEPIYGVVRPHAYHLLSKGITAALLVGAAFVIADGWRRRPAYVNVLYLFALGSLIAPMTLTQAHENHLYLGGLLAVVVAAVSRSRALVVLVQVLLVLQFVNLFGLYGLGMNHLSQNRAVHDFVDLYSRSPAARVTLAVLAVIVFAGAAVLLVRTITRGRDTEPAAVHG